MSNRSISGAAKEASAKRGSRLPQIALIWSQFTDTHVDRCNAVAERFQGRAEILAVEIATTSTLYAQFSPGREMGGGRKATLFPGQSFDAIPRWRRTASSRNSA